MKRLGLAPVPGRLWVALLFLVCAWLLSANLGRTRLFEPDEGRNAEIAREVLLLQDWVTPHYDFLPRLDKPILYFDLVAVSFLLFGVSEWSARLPSAVAALACAAATYRLARALHGRAAALWSVLILVTSIEFFVMSQIVILDMFLTLSITLGLACFFLGTRNTEQGAARFQFLCMYLAFGVATLTKGPIGFLLPAMIILLYIVATRRWGLLPRMELPLGTSLFLAIVVPWYVLAEIRNPGYLRHFLLQENFARFATTRFHRTESWYFYLLVLPLGFFPWTLLLPRTAGYWVRRPIAGEALFLGLWALTPLLVFSLSISKMAHYVLPVFPPLSIMVGAAVAEAHRWPVKVMRSAVLAAWAYPCLVTVLVLVLAWPQILPSSLEIYATSGWRHVSISAFAGLLAIFSIALALMRSRLWGSQAGLYLTTIAGFALLVQLSPAVTGRVADHRSSNLLAKETSAHIGPADQLVLYGGYHSSLPFYLKLRRPIWVVRSENSREVLGSDYVALQRPDPAPGFGRVLYGEDEIAQLWRTSDQRLVALVRNKRLNRFIALAGAARVLARMGDTVLVANRPSSRDSAAMPSEPNNHLAPLNSNRES